MDVSVIPSFPAQSFDELLMLAQKLEGVISEFQIDIVDGKFVSAISWPFTEEQPLTALERLNELPDSLSVELDCMLLHPEQYLDLFVELHVHRVIIHIGSTDTYEEIIAHAQVHGYTLGFALTNDIPLSELEPYIDRINFVQVMGIKHVGKQGEPFDMRTPSTISELREKYPNLEIAVDGSVNQHTMIPLLHAGANRFAPGSAIAKAEDPVAAYHQLYSLVTT